MSAEHLRLDVAGRTLAVHLAGPDDAPTALLAHGIGSSARFLLDAFGAPLAAVGYRLAAIDLRGHGDSDPAPEVADHAVEEHVADLEAVADRLGARVVGGVSLGAHAAALLASGRDDLDGLLLVLPAWTSVAAPGEGPHALVADEVRRVGVDAALRRAVADPAVPGWLAGLLERDWRRADEASLAAALVALDGARAPEEADLAAITAPTGIVGWPADPAHPLKVARIWAELITCGALATTTMAAVGRDAGALGRAAVTALGKGERACA